MFDSLKEFLKRYADTSSPSHPTPAERNEWDQFGQKLNELTSDEALIESVKSDPQKLKQVLQRKLDHGMRHLKSSQTFREQGRKTFALSVIQDGLSNLLDGIGPDHQLTFQLLVEGSRLLREMHDEPIAVDFFRRPFATIPDEVNSDLLGHFLWYAESRMSGGLTSAALEGFRVALTEATERQRPDLAKEASLGIAVIFRDQGELENAATVLEELLEASDPEIDPVPKYTLLHELAAIKVRLNEAAEARELLSEAQLRCREALPESRATYVRVLQTMIYTETVAGNNDLASVFTEEIRQFMQPSDPAWTAIKLQDTERLMQSRETLEDAVSLLGTVQETAAKHLDYESSEYALLMETWGQLAKKFDRQKTVRWAFKEALRLRQSVSGIQAPETAQVMLEWANLKLQDGDIQQAVNLAAGARQVFLDTMGRENIHFARATNAFARCCLELGAFDDAEEAFREAGKSYSVCLGPEARETLVNRSGIGSVLFKREQFGEAETVFRKALDGLNRTTSSSVFDRQVTAIRLNHSATLVALKRWSEAEQVIGFVWEQLGDSTDERLLQGVILNQQFCIQHEQEEFSQALMTIRRAIPLTPEQHPARARILFNQSVCEVVLGKAADAVVSAETALSILESSLGPQHPDSVHVSTSLAELRKATESGVSIRLLPLFSLVAA